MNSGQSIIGPEVIKMLGDSVVKTSWKRFFVSKSAQESQPVSQALRFILKTHLLLLVVDNFNNTAHNVGEENHTAKHVTHSNKDFGVALWIVVSVTHSCQRCHGVVPTDDQPVVDILVLHVELVPEGFIFFVFVSFDDHVPDAATEISYNNSEDE